jgi:hypothetical protein
MSEEPAYTSDIIFDPGSHLDGLVLVCSDGRFEKHVDEFRQHLLNTLGLRKIDRYFIPGSQLQFLSAEAGYPDADLTTGYWARFFIEKHHTGQVVIIGHEHCAAYTSAPAFKGFSAEQLRRQQEVDLKQIRASILQQFPRIRVHLYYMAPREDNSGVDFFNIG